MILLSRRSLLAIAAVVDIALHARPSPVAAKPLSCWKAMTAERVPRPIKPSAVPAS